MQFAPEDSPHSEKYQREVCLASVKKITALINYVPSFPKLKSTVKLYKPSRPTYEDPIADDFELSNYVENPVEISTFEGNHVSILKNAQIAYAINNVLDSSNAQFFKTTILKENIEAPTNKEASVH